ncbi:hypothetical protein Rs2_16527 [Raphanus sativus]|nr:hypothetical protein Rs2_16527 [Raphanus sativus]
MYTCSESSRLVVDGVNDMPAHVREECCGGEDAAVEEVGGGAVGPDGLKNVLDDKAVTCISDSPSKLRARHKPVEAEADLAALLLAKEPFRLEKIVPFELDPDYVFFEQVLLSGPKVTHMGLPVCDMDNQFFLDLAASQKWVTSKHMEVLMYYVGERHAELFKLRRVMFVAPWFMEQLGGKAEAFASSRYKGRVFSDRKLAGYLTRVGQKLGVDVDEVFAPMIWGGNHWVGLRISITGWNVLVYDPDRTLRKMEEVMSLMTQIAQMLPYVVRKVCGAGYLKAHGLEPFSVSLMADGYQNTRSGDCGPVAVKFMELAATGVEEPDVKDITDGAVDCFRKQWAMDLYKDWIVPLYICGDGEHEDGGA